MKQVKHLFGNLAVGSVARQLVLAALIVSLISGGCMRRRMTVRSNPPGALVYVDKQEIGVTPVSTPFTYYGTREIQLVKGGYETIKVDQQIRTPWYEYPPLDFVTENLWPFEVRDERVLDFQLVPQQVIPDSQLIQRAEQLRGSAAQGYVVPLPDRPANAIGSIPAPVPPSPLGEAAGDARYPLPAPAGPPSQNLPGPQPVPAPGAPLSPPGTPNLSPTSAPLGPPASGVLTPPPARRPLGPPR